MTTFSPSHLTTALAAAAFKRSVMTSMKKTLEAAFELFGGIFREHGDRRYHHFVQRRDSRVQKPITL
jgi:hypothetical protein